MSNDVRVLETLFDGTETIVTAAAGTVSKVCSVGPAEQVAILVQNASGAVVTVVIDVAAATSLAPGRNAMPAANSPLWTRLFKRDGSAAYSLTVANNGTAAIDLSPFAAHYVRVNAVRTGSDGTGVTAQAVCNG